MAGEIRTLAENCSASVTDIVNTTENMRKLVNVVLEKSAENKDAISESTAVVADTETTFEHIRQTMGEIDAAMDTVHQSIVNVESVATDISASGKTLAELSNSLTEQIGKFTFQTEPC